MDEKDLRKKKIGTRIKAVRTNLGLTMKEFGKKFDPPAGDSIVSRWERGISSPNNDRIEKIAELGNISTFYLTTGKKALFDLTDDEKIEGFKGMKHQYGKFKEYGQEQVKKDIEVLLSRELNFAETSYLVNVLNFLRYSDSEDVIFLGSIVRMLNSTIGDGVEDVPVTQEETKNFIDGEIKDIREFLEKRFQYKEGE